MEGNKKLQVWKAGKKQETVTTQKGEAYEERYSSLKPDGNVSFSQRA